MLSLLEKGGCPWVASSVSFVVSGTRTLTEGPRKEALVLAHSGKAESPSHHRRRWQEMAAAYTVSRQETWMLMFSPQDGTAHI